MELRSFFCSHHGTILETTLLALRDCPRASALWLCLIKVEDRSALFGGDLIGSTSTLCELAGTRLVLIGIPDGSWDLNCFAVGKIKKSMMCHVFALLDLWLWLISVWKSTMLRWLPLVQSKIKSWSRLVLSGRLLKMVGFVSIVVVP